MAALKQDWRHDIENLKGFNKFLFNNELMSDVQFRFEREGEVVKTIFAHSWILSTISAIFYDSMRKTFETGKLIPIVDHQYDDFLAFIEHFYDTDCAVDEKRYPAIQSLCEKYSVLFIHRKYEKLLLDMQINLDNALDRLELAVNMNCEDEVNRTLHFIGIDMLKYLTKPKLIDLSSNVLKSFLNINKIRVELPEFDLFTAIMKWAAYICKKKEWTVNSVNKRRSLGDLIKLIRFPLMTSEQFANCVKAEDNLLSPEERSAIFMEIASEEKNEFGFISFPRIKYTELFFDTKSSTIATPNTVKQKVTVKFYNEEGKLIFDDVQMVNFFSVQNYKQFPLKRSVHLTPYLKYSIDNHYENLSDVLALKKRLPQEHSRNGMTLNFTEIGDAFQGIIFYMN